MSGLWPMVFEEIHKLICHPFYLRWSCHSCFPLSIWVNLQDQFIWLPDWVIILSYQYNEVSRCELPYMKVPVLKHCVPKQVAGVDWQHRVIITFNNCLWNCGGSHTHWNLRHLQRCIYWCHGCQEYILTDGMVLATLSPKNDMYVCIG